MDITLQKAQFVDGRFSIAFGVNKTATFIVVNESFLGNNNLGVIDRINIFIATYDAEGVKIGGHFSPSIIGIGDGIAGILTEDESLLGSVMTWNNMESCVVRLYE